MICGLAIHPLPHRYRGGVEPQRHTITLNLEENGKGGKIFLPNDKIFAESSVDGRPPPLLITQI
jgi:hypothetical protein